MNRISDLRDLCQLWADDVASFEQAGRIDRVASDALQRFARSFFTGLVAVAGVRRLVLGSVNPEGETFKPSASVGGVPKVSQDKKSVVDRNGKAEEENKVKIENASDLRSLMETKNEPKNRL